jgi:hypothetical protein
MDGTPTGARALPSRLECQDDSDASVSDLTEEKAPGVMSPEMSPAVLEGMLSLSRGTSLTPGSVEQAKVRGALVSPASVVSRQGRGGVAHPRGGHPQDDYVRVRRVDFLPLVRAANPDLWASISGLKAAFADCERGSKAEGGSLERNAKRRKVSGGTSWSTCLYTCLYTSLYT